jgi:peroxiredoxin
MTEKMMRNLLINISFLVLLFSTTASAGEKFDDFNGNQKSVADYTGKGKWLVVMLWASDCHVCNQEAHQYVNFHKQHKGKDAQVLGISLDGKTKQSDAKEFLKRHNINFPSLIGEPENVATMYQELTGGTWVGTPSFMVYTPSGELLGAQAGAVPVSVIESFIERESATTQPKS